MSVWVLVAAYLAVFVLLQVAVYRYVRRDDDGGGPTWGRFPNAEAGPHRDRPVDTERSGREGERFDDARANRDRARDAWADDRFEGDSEDRVSDDDNADVDGSTRRCPNCGARNASEQVFVFCRQCAGPLGR